MTERGEARKQLSAMASVPVPAGVPDSSMRACRLPVGAETTPFFPYATFGHGVYHSSRTQTRICEGCEKGMWFVYMKT